jgi:glycosyltransferase involved in cell wall biosynthesis
MQLSIVIICLNEEKHLSRCLEAIFFTDHDGIEVEVIVADGGSTDSTIAIAKRFGARVIGCPRGIPRQRNAGARAATGALLAYVDADVQLLPGWFHAVRLQFLHDHNKIVGSAPHMPEDVSWAARAYAQHRGTPEEHSIATSSQAGRYLSTQSLVMGREIFSRVGGFREDLYVDEDTEFIVQARNYSIPLYYDSNLAYIHHGEPRSLGEFFHRVKWGANYRAWFQAICQGDWSKASRMQYLYGFIFFVGACALLASLLFTWVGSLHGAIPFGFGLFFATLIAAPALRLSIKKRHMKNFLHYCAMYSALGAANAAAMLGFSANKAKRWR